MSYMKTDYVLAIEKQWKFWKHSAQYIVTKSKLFI